MGTGEREQDLSSLSLPVGQTELMMNTSKDGSRPISRRVALALGTTAAGMAVRRAGAQQKLAQNAVQYQDQPKGPQRCDGCAQFQPPNACKLVQGTISPSGWCLLFSPKT